LFHFMSDKWEIDVILNAYFLYIPFNTFQECLLVK
jgi:hypothetical protein